MITEAQWNEKLFNDFTAEPEEESEELEYGEDDTLRDKEGDSLMKFNRDRETWTAFDKDGEPFEVDPDQMMALARWLVEND